MPETPSPSLSSTGPQDALAESLLAAFDRLFAPPLLFFNFPAIIFEHPLPSPV
jgi:hypothetical protein